MCKVTVKRERKCTYHYIFVYSAPGQNLGRLTVTYMRKYPPNFAVPIPLLEPLATCSYMQLGTAVLDLDLVVGYRVHVFE